MKTTLFAMGLSVAMAVAPAFASPKVGEAMPSFSVTSIEGETISNETLKDSIYVLEWTNHECPFVKKHYGAGNMQATQKSVIENDAIWISIVSSAPKKQGYVTPEEASELSTSRNATPTHIVLDEDGSLGRLFEAKTTPHMFVADRTDTLRYAGAIDSIPSANPADISKADNYVLDAVAAIKSGEEVAKKQSKPYGCGVKY